MLLLAISSLQIICRNYSAVTAGSEKPQSQFCTFLKKPSKGTEPSFIIKILFITKPCWHFCLQGPCVHIRADLADHKHRQREALTVPLPRCRQRLYISNPLRCFCHSWRKTLCLLKLTITNLYLSSAASKPSPGLPFSFEVPSK